MITIVDVMRLGQDGDLRDPQTSRYLHEPEPVLSGQRKRYVKPVAKVFLSKRDAEMIVDFKRGSTQKDWSQKGDRDDGKS